MSATLAAAGPFSLAETCAPVAWLGGRGPNVDWHDGALHWCGWDGSEPRLRIARQKAPLSIEVASDTTEESDRRWAVDVLGIEQRPPRLSDPVVSDLGKRFAGLRLFSAGSLFDGIVAAIVGQSISVASAAVTERRLAALFHPGVDGDHRRFFPMPRPFELAQADVASVRTTGVTWRRAEALVLAAQKWEAGELSTSVDARLDPSVAKERLRALRLVGEWTAASALLWGLGTADDYPPGDVALLRAARRAYAVPELDHHGLDALAEGWRPGRAWAARWLWTDLLGTAP